MAGKRGQILVKHLFLQGDRRCRNDQPLAAGFRNRQGGDQVGQRFSRAGTRFKHAYMAVAYTLTFTIAFDIPQRTGNFGNHQPLPVAWGKLELFHHATVGVLNIAF